MLRTYTYIYPLRLSSCCISRRCKSSPLEEDVESDWHRCGPAACLIRFNKKLLL